MQCFLMHGWGLGIFGPIILLAILVAGLLYVAAVVWAVLACRKLLRAGEIEQFWLTTALIALLTVPVAVLFF